MGYIRFPYLDENHSFWLGVSSSLALLVGVFIVRYFFTLRPSVYRSASNKNTYLRLAGSMALLGLVVFAIVLCLAQSELEAKIDTQAKLITEQNRAIDSIQSCKLNGELQDLLKRVELEISASSENNISEETMRRLKIFNSSLVPYKKVISDSAISLYSPQRGRFLLGLLSINMSESSLSTIKERLSFSQSYLKGANLKEVDLSNINMSKSYLCDADLSGSVLNKINLSGSDLSRAILNGVELKKSDLQGTKMVWTEMKNAEVMGSNLDCTNLTSAQLQNAILSGSRIYWANLEGVMLNNAVLDGCTFSGVGMAGSNLTNAKLDLCKMRLVDLENATLDNAKVQIDWLENLIDWRIAGDKEILKNYAVKADTVSESGASFYLVKK